MGNGCSVGADDEQVGGSPQILPQRSPGFGSFPCCLMNQGREAVDLDDEGATAARHDTSRRGG